MTAAPYPRNLMHVGAARALTLASPLTVPSSGDITITVTGDISTMGWISVPSGQAIVVTVGRGQAYEAKYLVTTITFGTSTSTMTVLAADRNYDGTLPVDAPAGATVEHTISAAEMTSVTSHMRTKVAHGADGELVDTQSAQVLQNKTFNNPTSSGDPVTKGYAEAKFFPKDGGVVTGAVAIVPPGSAAAFFYIRGAAGFQSQVAFQTGSSSRWLIGRSNGAETGADAGSDFVINRCSDAGTWVTAVAISRKTGLFETTGDVVVRKPYAGIVLDAETGDLPGIAWKRKGSIRWRVEYNSGIGILFARYNSSGGYLGCPLAITDAGDVKSASHVAGVWTGTTGTGLYAGIARITLPTSPTGQWSVTVSGGGFEAWTAVKVMNSDSTYVDVFVYNAATGNGLSGETATVHWHAIAY